jgi:hypothetical protein
MTRVEVREAGVEKLRIHSEKFSVVLTEVSGAMPEPVLATFSCNKLRAVDLN